MIDKVAFEEAREFQIALEHARMLREAAEQHVSFAAELVDAELTLEHHWVRHATASLRRWFAR